jgi:hypothetical protein
MQSVYYYMTSERDYQPTVKHFGDAWRYFVFKYTREKTEYYYADKLTTEAFSNCLKLSTAVNHA